MQCSNRRVGRGVNRRADAALAPALALATRDRLRTTMAAAASPVAGSGLNRVHDLALEVDGRTSCGFGESQPRTPTERGVIGDIVLIYPSS